MSKAMLGKWKAVYFAVHDQWDVTNDAGDPTEEFSVFEDMTQEKAERIVNAVNRDHLFDELVATLKDNLCDGSNTYVKRVRSEARAVLAKVEAAKEAGK